LFQLPYSSTLNVGAEYMRERESSSSGSGPVGAPTIPGSSFIALRTNSAAYAEMLGSLTPRASYVISTRVDDNSDFDAVSTFRAGSSVAVTASTRLRVSLSTAFNAPAFNQILPTLYTTGSPGLDPERTRSYELGVEQTLFANKVWVTADYFNQRFGDLIQFVAGGPPNFLGSYANLTAAESNGYDIEVALTPDAAVSATASYTVASPRVTELAASYEGDLRVGQALIRRASHTGAASLRYRRKGVGSLSAAASYVGRRPDLDFTQFPSPVVTLPAYMKFDLAGSVDLLERLALTARIENAFDRKYEDVFHFAAPGRVILVGARYSGTL
ncbi:MAG: TonB-dependent receptor, partial [Gemmatimonadaceae bacterium]